MGKNSPKHGSPLSGKWKELILPSPASTSLESEISNIAPSGDLNLDIKSIFKILSKIAADTSHINAKITEIDAKLDAMDERFDKMETRISTLEDHEEECLGKMAEMEKKLQRAWDCMEDLKNHSRRNNIRIMDLPEGVEEGRPIDFLKKHLPVLLDLPEDESLEIERAHRSLAPRPIIMRLLKFRTRELLLRKAREKQSVSQFLWDNHKLFFFQDLSKEVQLKWKAFAESK
ncbi:uncharacterized protein LOC106701876 [Latimeria chalumnae]|uniref:uncharacterized protein LOC106701876 n=1 Tax=Latimeria chalumnae TaxID=7897 RepID=UPI0006D928A5|nr:PREDICTED: uncharacterized protein LOC106701876 [Latimeria chalumnae]|eukprot:XP_014339336.1 PREDICTED: uncharacterized protein LOC106701876 [Latimeria chalumnae]